MHDVTRMQFKFRFTTKMTLILTHENVQPSYIFPAIKLWALLDHIFESKK